VRAPRKDQSLLLCGRQRFTATATATATILVFGLILDGLFSLVGHRYHLLSSAIRTTTSPSGPAATRNATSGTLEKSQQNAPHLFKPRYLLVYQREALLDVDEELGVNGIAVARVEQGHEWQYLFQREAEPFCLPNEVEATDVGIRIEAIAVWRPQGLWQKAHALVVPDRLGRQIRTFSELADVE